MITNIRIESDDIAGLYTGLTELRSRIKELAKSKGLNPSHDEFTHIDSEVLTDDNCYGSCEVEINGE